MSESDIATTSAPPAKVKKPNPREAALLAAEARFGRPSSSSSSAPTPAATTSTDSKATGSSTPPLFRSASSSSGQAAKWTPTEKEEKDCRIKFARLLDRGLVRDNGYRQVAEGVETLILIAKNVMDHDDPKYRTLKATNSMLKNKVLSLKGGHEYLVALGFRTQTIDFAQNYVFHSSLKSSFDLKMGVQVLSDHLTGLQARAANAALSAQSHKETEAARVAQALAQIEADRDGVQLRLQRNNIMREREERLKREEKERLQREEEEMERRQEEAERTGAGGAAGIGGGMSLATGLPAGPAAQEDDDMDEDADEEEGSGVDEDGEQEEGEAKAQWGQGRTLGE